MTRFVIDAGALIHLASEGIEVAATHQLLAPTLVRSQTLCIVHEAVHRGDISADVGRDRLARIGQMKIRYLGDAVLRARAWDLAEQLGWASTYDAEYVALTRLQGDALVTLDAEFRRSVEEIVPVASIEDVQNPTPRLTGMGTNADRVKGPRSYFPSIEKKYGRSIEEWMALLPSAGTTKHMQLVNWLKVEHGMGHGHANAIVAVYLSPDR